MFEYHVRLSVRGRTPSASEPDSVFSLLQGPDPVQLVEQALAQAAASSLVSEKDKELIAAAYNVTTPDMRRMWAERTAQSSKDAEGLGVRTILVTEYSDTVLDLSFILRFRGQNPSDIGQPSKKEGQQPLIFDMDDLDDFWTTGKLGCVDA